MTRRAISRRDFMRIAAAGTCGAAIHRLFAPLDSMLAYAAPPVLPAFSAQPVLVLVNLVGGASYNVAPVYHGTYRDLNPSISYGAEDSLALSADQGLHPSLTSLQQVYQEGNLALLNLVGYPDPNRSHDESFQIWARGIRASGNAYGGWAARLTCQMASMFSGISLSGSNLLIEGDCNPPRAFGNLTNFGEDRFKWNDNLTQWLRITRESVLSQSSSAPTDNLRLVRDAMDNVARSVDIVRQETSAELPNIPAQFPNTSFGQACRDAARLIRATSLQTRFIYLEKGGFDTHSDERARLTSLLSDVNAGLNALVQTLKALGRWNDVVIASMSEFCRTFENGSEGTDHGHAAPLLVMGGSISGGIKSPTPTPAETSSARNYYHHYHVDFRQIFKEIITAMGYDSTVVFPETISHTPLHLFT